MKEFLKTINKYAILIIIPSIFGKIWFFILPLMGIFENSLHINDIPYYFELLINIIIIILLIFDFRKYKLKNALLTCIAALFFPLFGVVMFSILLFLKEREEITN